MSITLHIDGKPVTLKEVARKGTSVAFTLGGKDYHFRSFRLPDGSHVLEQETAPGVWQRTTGSIWQAGKDAKRVQLGALEAKVTEPRAAAAEGTVEGALSPTAPMPGLVRQVLVKKGERVAKGQPLVVMEAMKLQMTLVAGGDGTVEAILAKAGDMVSEGAELVRLSQSKKK